MWCHVKHDNQNGMKYIYIRLWTHKGHPISPLLTSHGAFFLYSKGNWPRHNDSTLQYMYVHCCIIWVCCSDALHLFTWIYNSISNWNGWIDPSNHIDIKSQILIDVLVWTNTWYTVNLLFFQVLWKHFSYLRLIKQAEQETKCPYFDGFVQNSSSSLQMVLGIPQSCTKLLIPCNKRTPQATGLDA